MSVITRFCILALAPLAVLTAQTECLADYTTGASAPAAKQQVTKTTKVMDRPEMAELKRIQLFAFKFRQKLQNMNTVLHQNHRTGYLSESDFKKLKDRMAALEVDEPGLARNNFNPKEVEAFQKKLEKFDADMAKMANSSAGNSTGSNSSKTEQVVPNKETELKKKTELKKDAGLTKDASKKAK